MNTSVRIAMRAPMMGVTLLIAVAACLAAQTSSQHVTVALFILLYCALRTVSLSVIERSELVMQGVQHAPATLVRLREERLRSRRQASVECGLLSALGLYAALRVLAPALLLH